MAHWSGPLVAFLAAQPSATTILTLSLAEIDALVHVPVPASAAGRYYWLSSTGTMSRRLAAIGWRMVRVDRRPLRITFARMPGGTI